ncbi:MAG: TonB-dependent receptor plug domain-containing protein [Balneola sp.]
MKRLELFMCFPILITLGVLPFTVSAQNNSVLRTIVNSEEDGIPLPGANVLIFEDNQDTEKEEPYSYCITDKDGFCEIRDLTSSKEWVLKVTYIGFSIYEEIIVLEQDERKVLRISLRPVTGEIGEVTVESQRYISTGEVGIRRISQNDISRIPAVGVDGDLATYLQAIPGVITNGDRGGDVYIRGGAPDQNRILIDNLLIVKPFHISNLFSAFPEQVIQSVDLYAGGFGAEHSGATSAVLDVSFRPGNMKEFSGSAAASPYMNSIFIEGPLEKDRQSFFFMGRKSEIDRFASELIGEEVNIEFSDFIGRYSIQTDNISCNITGIQTYDSGEIVPSLRVNGSWKNTVIGGNCLGYDELNDFPVEVTFGYTSFENREGSDSETFRSSSVNKLYLSTDRQEEAFGTKVDFGFGITFNNYKTELSEKFSSFESLDRKVPIVNAYGSSEFDINEQLIAQVGFATQISLISPATFEPRARFSYKIDDLGHREVSLAVGRYSQTVSGISDERDIGTVFTVLKPIEEGDPTPSSLHGIVGYNERRNLIEFNVEGYIKKEKNVPVSKWNPRSGIELETAFAKGLIYGFDINTQYKGRKLFMAISYGWSKITYSADTDDLGAWLGNEVFSYSPFHDQRHKLNTIISYEFFGFDFSSSWELGSGRPFSEILGYDFNLSPLFQDPEVDPGSSRILYEQPFAGRLPYYHRLDVSLGRSFKIGPLLLLESEIGAINTYDRNNILNFDILTFERVDQTPLLPYLSIKLQMN